MMKVMKLSQRFARIPLTDQQDGAAHSIHAGRLGAAESATAEADSPLVDCPVCRNVSAPEGAHAVKPG